MRFNNNKLCTKYSKNIVLTTLNENLTYQTIQGYCTSPGFSVNAFSSIVTFLVLAKIRIKVFISTSHRRGLQICLCPTFVSKKHCHSKGINSRSKTLFRIFASIQLMHLSIFWSRVRYICIFAMAINVLVLSVSKST